MMGTELRELIIPWQSLSMLEATKKTKNVISRYTQIYSELNIARLTFYDYLYAYVNKWRWKIPLGLTEININKINRKKYTSAFTYTHLCCNLLGLDETDLCVGRDWNYQRVSLNFQITCNDWDQLNTLELTNWSMSQSSLETICR